MVASLFSSFMMGNKISGYNAQGAIYLSKSLASGYPAGAAIDISNNGVMLNIASNGSTSVNNYVLSTPYDISTHGTISSGSAISSPIAAFVWGPSGTTIYIVGFYTTYYGVSMWNVATPYDSATIINSKVNQFLFTAASLLSSLCFDASGTQLFVTDKILNTLLHATLSSPWDLTTATYINSVSVSTYNTTPIGVQINPNGKQIYISSSGNQVTTYSLSTPFDTTTLLFKSTRTLSEVTGNANFWTFGNNGLNGYVIDSSTGTIYEYSTA